MAAADFARIADARRFSDEKMRKEALLAGRDSLLDLYCLRPGQAQKAHVHEGSEKYYVVLEGRVTVQLGDERRILEPGEAALARAGVEHGLANEGEADAVVLVFLTPKPSH